MTRTTKTLLLGTAVALAGTLAVSTPAGAEPAQHDTFVESYEGTEAIGAEENPCGAWAASLHEVRSGEYKIVATPGGRSEGEFHVNGAVDGAVEMIPDDPGLPTYTGSYREKVNAIITGYDEEEGDLARFVHFRLRLPLTGSDGSALVLTMSGTFVMDAQDRVRVARSSMSCS